MAHWRSVRDFSGELKRAWKAGQRGFWWLFGSRQGTRSPVEVAWRSITGAVFFAAAIVGILAGIGVFSGGGGGGRSGGSGGSGGNEVSIPQPVTISSGVVLYPIATGPVGTHQPASMRTQPNTQSRILKRLPNGTLVRILCTARHGEFIHAYLGNSAWWDYVQPVPKKFHRHKGYVFDGLVNTKVNAPIGKPC